MGGWESVFYLYHIPGNVHLLRISVSLCIKKAVQQMPFSIRGMSFKTPGCNVGKKRKWQDYKISLSFFQSCLHCMKWEIQPIMNPKYATETDKEEIFTHLPFCKAHNKLPSTFFSVGCSFTHYENKGFSTFY